MYLNAAGGLLAGLLLFSCSKDNLENNDQKTIHEDNLFKSSEGYTTVDFYTHLKNNTEVSKIPEKMESVLTSLDESTFLTETNPTTLLSSKSLNLSTTSSDTADCYDFYKDNLVFSSYGNPLNAGLGGGWLGYGYVDLETTVSSYSYIDFFSAFGTYDSSMFSVTSVGNWGTRNALKGFTFTIWGYSTQISKYTVNGVQSNTNVASTEDQDIYALRFNEPIIEDCIGIPSTATLAYRTHSYSNTDVSDTGTWSDWKTGGDWAFETEYNDSGIFTGFKIIDGIQFSIMLDNYYYVEDNGGGPFPF